MAFVYSEGAKNNRERIRKHQEEYRHSSKGATTSRLYNARAGRTSGRVFQVFIASALKELIEETQRANAAFQRASSTALTNEYKTAEKAKRAFIQKIFQPGTCVDCGVGFETLYPSELVAFGIVNPMGVVRCRICARQRRLKNHGGGPRRRCTQFGVPYEVISPGAIFHRDDYKCRLCGGDLDMSAGPHDPKAPEIDHKIPLSAPNSPGHVFSNVQSAHRECNLRKGARHGETPNE